MAPECSSASAAHWALFRVDSLASSSIASNTRRVIPGLFLLLPILLIVVVHTVFLRSIHYWEFRSCIHAPATSPLCNACALARLLTSLQNINAYNYLRRLIVASLGSNFSIERLRDTNGLPVIAPVLVYLDCLHTRFLPHRRL
jgi:hypothetical protein